jgi:hypothetical protein
LREDGTLEWLPDKGEGITALPIQIIQVPLAG